MKIYRPTWAEVDLRAIKFNFRQIKKMVGQKVKTMAVVKANAYGHGIVEVSRTLSREGVDYLGVASVDEALNLRAKSVKDPVLVLGSVLPHEVNIALRNNITLTLSNNELFKVVNEEARNRSIRAKVHVKVDTGMGRIGVWHQDAIPFIKRIFASRYIEVEGLYTHFSVAARDKLFTLSQIESFENLIRVYGGYIGIGDYMVNIPFNPVVRWACKH